MLRRSFLQVVSGIAASLGNLAAKVRPDPAGWTISWHELPDSPTSAGFWLALPTTADRDTAFRSLVPRDGSDRYGANRSRWGDLAREKRSGRKRVEAMICASRNGSRSVPTGLFSDEDVAKRVKESQ